MKSLTDITVKLLSVLSVIGVMSRVGTGRVCKGRVVIRVGVLR